MLQFKIKFARCDSYPKVLNNYQIYLYNTLFIFILNNNHIYVQYSFFFQAFLEILFINCLWYFVDHIFVCIH